MSSRKRLFVAAGLFVCIFALAVPNSIMAACCNGYCACVDWQSGGNYAGCVVSYDANDNIESVTCAYISIGFEPIGPNEN